MKKIYSLIVLILCAAVSYGQAVTGTVTRTNSTPVKLVTVHMYPDTNVGPQVFQPMTTTTDTSGAFGFTMPGNVPLGTVFCVATLDCDSVSYKKNTHIFAGNNINSPLVICVVPPTNFSGYVYLGGASKRPKVKEALVYLIAKCAGDVLIYIDSVETDTNGYYAIDTFPKLATGCELIMKAALKHTSTEYKQFLPAYHENNTSYKLKWSGARDIPYNVAKNGITIVLPEAINPSGGPSIISGYAREEASTTRLPDKVMFITDMDDVSVDYTYTESNGYYKFGNLPFGTYKVFGDVWGKDNIDFIATVDANHVNILNLVFTENTTEYKGHIATSVAGRNELVKTISVYPNPAKDRIYIKGAENIKGQKQILLSDITGTVVYNTVFEAGAAVTVPVASLTPGVYILKFSTESETVVFRIAK